MKCLSDILAVASRRSRRRNGSAYVFVLGITLIITVLGMGALTVARVAGESAAAANDWEAAGALAFSATEDAVSVLNAAAAASPTTWRASYVSGGTAFSKAVGRGTMSWALKDETDGNLSADYLRPIRIYGIGAVGRATRVYSVRVIPAGTALDVLRTALHSASTIKLTGSARAVNGPISSNSSIQLSGTVNAAIEGRFDDGHGLGHANFRRPGRR